MKLIALALLICLPYGTSQAELSTDLPYEPGVFEPNWDSLAKGYECPEWFQNAKFGIWAHWGIQCVPGSGDWNAKFIYKPESDKENWIRQGERHYKHHVERYGHPSKIGLKDYCKDFTAEQWDPDHLLDLYKRAGAQYFVAMANHHDNFDNWNSSQQPWNSVNMGPKRDLIKEWSAAAKKKKMYFGVSVHAARTWKWLVPVFGHDREGPLQGLPYDGHMRQEDGKGTWWEGYDPQDLYGPVRDAGTPISQAYLDRFYLRCKELIDVYDPDLLYFDDGKSPLGGVGLKIAAHFYNQRIKRHGKLDVVLNTKHNDALTSRALVDDVERGSKNAIDSNPWQIDTCIGNWHYRENITYRKPPAVIHLLLDAVSKNGNMLLNIPMKADGSIEAGAITFLEEMSDWMAVHSEGIYDTRPWEVYGEGRLPDPEGNTSEYVDNQYDAKDFRFTLKGNDLYAFCMVNPVGDVLITSLATGTQKTPHTVKAVTLMGSHEKLRWEQTKKGLAISAPHGYPTKYSVGFKITLE